MDLKYKKYKSKYLKLKMHGGSQSYEPNVIPTIIIGCEDHDREKQCNFIDTYYNTYMKNLSSYSFNGLIEYVCYNNDGPFKIDGFDGNILNYNLKKIPFDKIIVIFEFIKNKNSLNTQSFFKRNGNMITITIYDSDSDSDINIDSALRLILLPPITTIKNLDTINKLNSYNPYYILLSDINKDIDLNIYEKLSEENIINCVFVSMHETLIPINTLSYEDPQYYDMYYHKRINDMSIISNNTPSLIVINDPNDKSTGYYSFLQTKYGQSREDQELFGEKYNTLFTNRVGDGWSTLNTCIQTYINSYR
jgi:hypothetical protein